MVHREKHHKQSGSHTECLPDPDASRIQFNYKEILNNYTQIITVWFQYEQRVKNIADAIFFTPDVCAGAKTSPDVNEKSSLRITNNSLTMPAHWSAPAWAAEVPEREYYRRESWRSM